MQIDEFKQLREDTRFHLLAYIADACNYDCSYCYNRKPRSGKMIDMDKLNDFIVKIHTKTEKRIDLELIGGEPMLHPKLYSFIEGLPSYVDVLVYTNGNHSIESLKRLLILNCRLFISWHSQNAEFLTTLNALNDWKEQIDVSVMYEPARAFQACNVFDALCSQGFKTSLALIDGNKALYSNAQLKQYNARHSSNLEFEITFDRQVQQISEEDAVNLELSFRNWICNAGQDYLYVHFDEKVYKCQTFFTNNHTPIACLDDDIQLSKVLCPFNRCECGFGVCKKRVYNIN